MGPNDVPSWLSDLCEYVKRDLRNKLLIGLEKILRPDTTKNSSY